MEHIPIFILKSKNNLMNSRNCVELLFEKINTIKIIIEPAEK